ncbi:DarT ssDNA thymidine ADP-ribosyltransferase family protein [Nodularia sp. UHCC 0506]|uniref:DarT ssDNA thymidine ADP-ribosyltransferase family protein n=1 Tax=Nodularia sp. UHCC 0506 TaxID=3110243 RepID=UPI002B1F5FE4|nr:DarT ssDNA thymidine ADP-ribosyltransferase family protein [Nodularia sp. UHCC 0506]MEA5517038.1 DarT ssDNA thymidine ADP-ribosyltransferase family protein [Nodularia sp. UHCC 0506]
MSNQLRYLLHGNKEKYQDITTPLYITSQDSTVWQKVGQQVLQIGGEDWRLIDPLIVEHIPSAKRQMLGIKLLQTEEVVDLIRELGADCVDGNLLEPSERYELLRHIRPRPNNQELWKALQLHETVNGELVCIESGKTYLENPDFPLDERLKEYIVLIRQNKQELDQNWIPVWTPDEAIATIVKFANPEKYCDLILNSLQQLSTLEKDKWESELKNIHWLVDVDSKARQPRDIIRLPINLVRHQEIISTLDSTKYSEISLPTSIKKHPAYSIVKKLFTFWNTESILEKIFYYPKKIWGFWRDFSPVILDALQDIDISKNPSLERLLTTETWLICNDKLIAPQQVIEIVSKGISKHLSTLVQISEGEYAELSLLSKDVQNHESLKIVKKLFYRWNENDVINFILSQSQPHLYLDIILDALSSLFSNANQRLLEDNHERLKLTPWLVDKDGNAIYPANVLHYPDIEIEIEELLLTISNSYIASSQLNQQIRNYTTCWQWLTKELFLTLDQVLSELGKVLKEADEYQLGKFARDEFPLDEVLQVFSTIDVSFLPAWNFAQKISLEKFKKYLLPNLLGELDEEKLIKILQNIVELNNEPEVITINVFNCYLKLAVDYHNFSQIIGQIRLLNHRGQWQTPDNLTWGNRENIDGAYLLNNEQTVILHSYLKDIQKTNSQNGLQSSVTRADETNSNVLQNYFRAWEQHCPPEPIGAFLTLLYGGEGSVKNLAHLYLGKRNLGDLRQRLFEYQLIAHRTFRVYVGQASERTREVESLIGLTFNASLVNTKNPPHLFVNKLAPDITEIELLPIQPQDFSPSELVNILRNSTRILLKEVYEVVPLSLNQIWENLLESDQLDIQVAKNFLLEGAPYVMRMLGAHERVPLIKTLLTSWDNCRHQRAELKQQNRSVENIDKKIENLISGLSHLLEDESSESEEVRKELLEAVRTKINLHGYRCQSIPFELFQNADDAVVEWQFMSSQQKMNDSRKQFIIKFDDNKIQFIHAGRPIGCFQHPNHPERQYKDKGFDRDLEKMLTFNISDKGEGVTGKFGLGFKSVYLACKRPYVLSKNLGFTVAGGLIPSRLNPQKSSELRGDFKRYIGLSDATITELELEENISWQNVLQDFQSVANILLVFSKAIKTCTFVDAYSQEITLDWHPSTVLNIPRVETGKYQTASNTQDSILLCLKTGGETKASLVLGLFENNGCLYKALPEKIPTFWVTAPTREELFLGFILNANFDITTGRESLVKSSVRNRELAQVIGKNLGEVLYSLFGASDGNWQALARTFGFTNVDEYEFWNFLWEELAVRWQQKDPSEGIDIISNMLTGNNRTMGYLITHCAALPSGLYGRYRQLISVDNVNYQVTGKLLDQNTFLQVANWPGFQQHYQNNLIARDKWQQVKKLLGEDFVQIHYLINDLRLIDILKNEMGKSQPRVGASQARYIGSLISKEFLNNFSAVYELNELQNFLETVYFMSKDGSYLPCQQLLISNSNAIEEKLLVDFAPDSRILHNEYQDTALNFFYACRSRRDSISKDEIIRWALQATTEEQRQAVYIYLLQGEQREEIASTLYANRQHYWFVNDKRIIDILELMVLIVIERGEFFPAININEIQEDEPEIDNYNPFFEIHTNCTNDDFSLQRTPEDIEEFSRKLQAGLNRQNSSWKGYIYHFTHLENAVSILTGEKLLARNLCRNFNSSAGANLIDRTRSDVKDFARFYCRPQTPTQWHNEGLGKRRGNIYALCPVPIFFRFDLKRVMETQGNKCGISSGNLAASGSHYGNSTTFLEQCFDFDHVYSTLEVGKETFLRASQQEFIVHNYLDFTELNLEDISIICRTTQDKDTLLNLIGIESKYANRVFKEREIVGEGSLYYHNNPYVTINDKGKFIDIQIDNYDKYGNINGELILSFTEQLPLNREIISPFRDISKINLGQTINVSSSRHLQLQYKPNTNMSIRFQENGQEWLIYTNEPKNN